MDEAHFNTLRELARDGTISQRELSRRMGLSLGKVNYIVNALLTQGFIEARRFKNARNRSAYRYLLTPRGVRVKAAQTHSFLQQKIDAFERLRHEIETLRQEAP